MKNPLTPAGIEPATFRFVAPHLNHCATAVPTDYGSRYTKSQKNVSAFRLSKLCVSRAPAHMQNVYLGAKRNDNMEEHFRACKV